MTRIAFLGLGRMGTLLAHHLIDAPGGLTVWNRTGSRAEPLAQAGAQVAQTPAAAVAGCELVISMLSGPESVQDVFFGEHGAAAALAPGSLVVEMSTIGPEAVDAMRAKLPAQVRLVDAPVLGSLPQAAAGELKIFVGGAAEDAETCREALASLGTVEHVGPLGDAAALKLVLNTVTISLFALVGEALAAADRLGLDTAHTLQSLNGTGIGPFLARIGDRIGDSAVPTSFALGLADKDLRLALASAGTDVGRHSATLLTAAVKQHLAAATQAGLADRDISTVIRFLRGELAD